MLRKFIKNCRVTSESKGLTVVFKMDGLLSSPRLVTSSPFLFSFLSFPFASLVGDLSLKALLRFSSFLFLSSSVVAPPLLLLSSVSWCTPLRRRASLLSPSSRDRLSWPPWWPPLLLLWCSPPFLCLVLAAAVVWLSVVVGWLSWWWLLREEVLEDLWCPSSRLRDSRRFSTEFTWINDKIKNLSTHD